MEVFFPWPKGIVSKQLAEAEQAWKWLTQGRSSVASYGSCLAVAHHTTRCNTAYSLALVLRMYLSKEV